MATAFHFISDHKGKSFKKPNVIFFIVASSSLILHSLLHIRQAWDYLGLLCDDTLYKPHNCTVQVYNMGGKVCKKIFCSDAGDL